MEEKIDIIKYRPIMSENLYEQFRNCFISLRENQCFSSAMWGAVFLEGFLNEFFEFIKIGRKNREDLNSQIEALQQYSKNPNPGSGSILVPDEIVKRCHDIRNTRNRLVHHTGLPKKTIDEDAKYIFGALQVILDWYLSFAPKNKNETMSQIFNEDEMIPVFISTITPHTERQVYFLDLFFNELKKIGIKPVKVEFDDFDQKDPLKKVKNVIKECDALIALGLEKSHSYLSRDKEGFPGDPIEEKHRKYTSGWLHMESGIACALEKEIFVICEKEIFSDGIFDRKWNTYVVTQIMSLDENSKELVNFLSHLKKWVKSKKK